MPRPSDPAAVAESIERSSTRMRRLAWFLALGASLLALLLGVSALVRLGTAPPSAVETWLIALGLACLAAAIGWALWRQAALAGALADARHEARAALALCDAWTWEADAALRLTRWTPPSGSDRPGPAASAVLGRTLWEAFGADAACAARLRARLEGSLPLQAQMVVHAGEAGQGAAQRLRLDAQPLAGASGRIARWVGSARAVDEAAAREHDQRLLQALLPTLPLPVFELTGQAQTAMQVRQGNAAAAQWLGMPAERLSGLPVAELLPRLPQDLRTTVAQALERPGEGADLVPCPGWQIRLQGVAAAGDAASATPAPHWLLVLMPIPRAQAAAPGAAADAESFSYTVSHDLRAPVRVVEGFTKILKEDYGRQLDRIGNDHLDRVLGAAARMNSMIDALLALAQLSSRPVSRQPVNLSQLAAFVVEDLRRQAPERKVSVHVEAGLQAQGDPTLLRVVLENLIGNAWKYSARTRNAQIRLERGHHAGQEVFTVRDNGAGFDMRFADRLFGVFQRLHSASDFPGTGIGLATVRRIVARHGGEIWAESEVDRGSSFHFTIPPATGGAG